MGLIRFDPSVLKRRPPVLSFCISNRAFSLAGGEDGGQKVVPRRTRADDPASERAGGQLWLS